MEKIEEFCFNILNKIGLKKVTDIYIEHKEGMRYLIFGALSTVINIIVAMLSYYILFVNFPKGWRVNISTLIAILAAWIFAYITNKWYVFNAKKDTLKELFQEILLFIGCRIITAIAELVLMNVFVTRLQFNYMLLKIISNVIVIILNFIFSKLLIFKKRKNFG